MSAAKRDTRRAISPARGWWHDPARVAKVREILARTKRALRDVVLDEPTRES